MRTDFSFLTMEQEREELHRLRAENAALREALGDAAIAMRNYYAQAISRAVVDEKLERYRQLLAPAPSDGGPDQ